MIATAVARTALAVALTLVGACGGEQPTAGDPISAGFTIHTADGAVRSSTLLGLARTPEARRVGLMGRQSLPSDGGMVFLFDEPTDSGFWMKDTLIPLSIAFWDHRDVIVDILEMTPCRTETCPVYRPQAAYVGAVEMNAGWFDDHGVAVGDRIEVELYTD